jgi:hypothetical protein
MKSFNDKNRTRCGKVLIMLTLTVIYFSCGEDFLKEKPKDFFAVSTAYSQPADIELGIVALHKYVRDWIAPIDADAICINWGTDLGYLGDNPGLPDYMQNYPTSLTPEHWHNNYFWTRAYTLIQRANVLLDAIEKMNEDVWTDQNQKNMLIGEAKFFRAYAYRQNVTLYGDIPLVTEVIDYAKTDFKRDSKEDVYALIESDLSFAASNLPARGNESAPGRITQGAAWHLLCEMYLAQAKYQQAVEAATHVINDYGYALMTSRFGTKLGADVFGTGDVYYDLFQEDNQNLPENTEAIWVLQIEPLVTGGGEYGGEAYYAPMYERLGNTPDGYRVIRGEFYNGAYTGYSDTLGRGFGWLSPSNLVKYYIWESDWNNDIRNAPHNIKRNFYFDNPGSSYHGMKIDFSLWEPGTRNALLDTNSFLFPYFMKVANPLRHKTSPARSGDGINHKDLYVMRLAETYLLRAEGYLGMGNNQKAADDINVVRNRANATPVSPGDVTIDYILDERIRELYTEEMRALTLIRTGKLVERVRKYNNNPVNPGEKIQDHNKLWPIPQSQIDLNVSADFPQNPGY